MRVHYVPGIVPDMWFIGKQNETQSLNKTCIPLRCYRNIDLYIFTWKYFLNIYYVPGTILVMCKIHKNEYKIFNEINTKKRGQ